jgi:hypothetical protein
MCRRTSQRVDHLNKSLLLTLEPPLQPKGNSETRTSQAIIFAFEFHRKRIVATVAPAKSLPPDKKSFLAR